MHALLRMVAAGPDPEGAQPLLERYFEAGGRAPTSDEGQRLLVALLAQGSYLADLLLRAPSELDRLERDPWLHVAKPAGHFAEEAAAACATATDEASLHRCLRGYARREMLRLGAREIGWGTTLQVARELSGLADACLDVAVRFLDAVQSRRVGAPTSPERPPGFVVLGMGKLGGEELNFSSDVDLVYVYATDEGSAGAMGLHEYYTRLGQQLTAAIDATTEDGRIFRVDLRLRPEGKAGALCNSLPACERYYETFGRTWERQALLRARPCAGDRALGAELLATLEPFVFPRSLHPSTS
jgi:glutamate-ammonia-ligase adenylyltransferase